MKKILFLCTGNTCRSPMAEALFNRLAAQRRPGFDYEAVSAGISAIDGEPPSTNAAAALEDYPGSNLSGHLAHKLDISDVNEADLVLAMAESHKQHVLSRFPGAYQKVFTLKEYVYGRPGDISDPFGGSAEDYRECAREIALAVELLVEKLVKDGRSNDRRSNDRNNKL